TGYTDPAQTFPLIKSFRDVWSADAAEGPLNGGLSASVGGEDPLFGHMVGYLASFSYSTKQEVRNGLYQALINGDGTTFTPYNVATGSASSASILWGGLFNVSTRIGATSKLSFNNSLTRSADNEATLLHSNNEEFSTPLRLTRLAFTTREVRSDQVAGEHLLGVRNNVSWSVTNSSTRRYEPDRSDIAYVDTGDPSTDYWFGSPRSATRTFSDLHESNWQLQGDWRRALDAEAGSYLKFGASWRATDRDAESRSYDILPLATLSQADRTVAPEELFSDQHVDDGWFTLQANVFGGVYEAQERLSAGYGMLQWQLGPRLTLLTGVRVERWDLTVDAFDPFGLPARSGGLTTDLLPSLGLTLALSADQNLRLSASRTVSRPEYRELAPIQYFEPLGGIVTVGNPDLERSLIQNYDARWEWFPRAGEVVSAGIFYKRFSAPIERVFQFRGGTRANTWLNAEGATNLGLELELRKNLGALTPALAPFSLATNVTLMRSRIQVDNDALTNTDRAMVGQAPYVVNFGLTWTTATDRPLVVSALYNVVGRRIVEAGAVPFPDTYEEARQLVDLSVEAPLIEGIQLKADAKNLLDQEVRWSQGSVTRNRYRPGREF
ncbi:MAG TPA: TonB-dependent receptor, partial [Gemmatimonadales bacterium]|nr:TonB-dependent receptor [Gemmatimonadales bacterium]